MNIQYWFPLGWADWISLLSKGLSRVFSSTTVWKHQFFSSQHFLWSNCHIHTWLLKKTIVLTIRTFVGKVMSLFFNMLSRFVVAFSSKQQASFNFMAAATVRGDFGAQGGKKVCHCFHRKIPQASSRRAHVMAVWPSKTYRDHSDVSK